MIDPHPSAPPSRRVPASIPRRTFLKSATAASLAATSLPLAASASTNSAHRPSRNSLPARAARSKPLTRNLIFMVADGMSAGTLSLAEMASRHARNRESAWVSLWRQPDVRRAAAATYSANSLVTDSAAASTAWACGHRVNNGALNISPDGTQHVPIFLHAAQNARATGLVTTTRVTHATPAGFLVNAPSRDLEDLIATQMLNRGCTVMLGGGARHFPPDLLAQHPSLRILRSADDLRALQSDPPAHNNAPLLGLFADSHMAFDLDRPPDQPSLAEMTRAALNRLDNPALSPQGFVLQIEGGRIDHAAHNNDAAALIADQLAFDDAVAVVREHTRDRDDTLVIVTTDHANANPGLTIYGKRSFDGFARTLAAKPNSSFDALFDAAKAAGRRQSRAEHLAQLVVQTRNIELDPEDRELLAAAIDGKRLTAFKYLANATSVLGGLLANTYGISFISRNHTADAVEILAWGPGSHLIPPMGHNTDLHRVMVEALALTPPTRLPDMNDPVPTHSDPPADD